MRKYSFGKIQCSPTPRPIIYNTASGAGFLQARFPDIFDSRPVLPTNVGYTGAI
jgi:hypothetical protein